jgi:hypothetical protein
LGYLISLDHPLLSYLIGCLEVISLDQSHDRS